MEKHYDHMGSRFVEDGTVRCEVCSVEYERHVYATVRHRATCEEMLEAEDVYRDEDETCAVCGARLGFSEED